MSETKPEPGTIRVSPESRLPPRGRRDKFILRDVRLAWRLTGRAVARMPLLFLASVTLWGAARFFALQGLRQAHLGLGGGDFMADFTFWGRLGLLADIALLTLGPVALTMVLMPPVHRMILGAAAASWPRGTARAGKLGLAILCLLLSCLLTASLCAGLPVLLRGALGQISTLLLQILLFPLAVAVGVMVFRFALGLAAISLGLPRGLAEGWMISSGHVTRALCVVFLTGLPALVAALLWWFLSPDPYGWPATILCPVTDVLSVALTASITGVLYRAYRLPAAFRPDLRPSRNRNQRRPPVFT